MLSCVSVLAEIQCALAHQKTKKLQTIDLFHILDAVY